MIKVHKCESFDEFERMVQDMNIPFVKVIESGEVKPKKVDESAIVVQPYAVILLTAFKDDIVYCYREEYESGSVTIFTGGGGASRDANVALRRKDLALILEKKGFMVKEGNWVDELKLTGETIQEE